MPTLKIKPITYISPRKVAQFWSHIDVGEPDACWLWRNVNPNKYPLFNLVGNRLSKDRRNANRIAFFLSRGRDTPLHVLHTCDNRVCVNPAHLFEGTNQDNINDKIAKGRQQGQCMARLGEAHGRTKLTDEQVIAIRHRYANGETQIQLAQVYGVTNGTISKITTGRTWTHIE